MKYNVKVTIVAEYQVDDTDFDIDDPKTTRSFIETRESENISDDLSTSYLTGDIKSIGVSVWKADQ